MSAAPLSLAVLLSVSRRPDVASEELLRLRLTDSFEFSKLYLPGAELREELGHVIERGNHDVPSLVTSVIELEMPNDISMNAVVVWIDGAHKVSFAPRRM
jgi:hypothetical protein